DYYCSPYAGSGTFIF
nr:immunoglobulin light chain junction region [Macaca mulatta]MOX29111.1 immunoglobulin light chain junction region [Macaca mulatta]MOX29307.1 immunoglobulin light chain junction region [Macaca mulatta]MOX29710.1 immunoglobulin light chain junction region [Macaca mulatta]MOX30003.1 immunoglobulin light chain junction region [Macaca mulatta]